MLAADYLEEIGWSFRKQKLRTALTSVGIAIGAFAITIMVGLGQGVQSYIEQQVMAFGNPRVVVVFPNQARQAEKFLEQITKAGKPAERINRTDEDARKERRGGLWITPEQVEKLKQVPGVEQVAPLTWLEIDGIALAEGAPAEAFIAPPPSTATAAPEAKDPLRAALERVLGSQPGPKRVEAPAGVDDQRRGPAPPRTKEDAPRGGGVQGPFLIRGALGARGGPGGSGEDPAPSTATSAPAAATLTAVEQWERRAAFFQTDFAALSTHPLVGTPSFGRLPAQGENHELIISPQYAESFGLRPEELIGREVAIRVPKLASITQRFLFRDPSQFRDEHRYFKAVVVGLGERSLISRAVYASLSLGREMARFQSGNQDILSDQKIGFQAHVKIALGANQRQVKAEIEKLGLVAKSVEDQLADVTRSFLVVKMSLSLFGMIAVLVATLGIANTLLMSISERTREIGVMKALGATEGTIRRMFAAEAAAIGFAGGLLGVAGAFLLGEVLNVGARGWLEADSFSSFRAFVFPWWLVLGAIGFSMAVGALAGLYPANRAARLDPIEALRHE